MTHEERKIVYEKDGIRQYDCGCEEGIRNTSCSELVFPKKTKSDYDFGLERAYRCYHCNDIFVYFGFWDQIRNHLKDAHGIEIPKEYLDPIYN